MVQKNFQFMIAVNVAASVDDYSSLRVKLNQLWGCSNLWSTVSAVDFNEINVILSYTDFSDMSLDSEIHFMSHNTCPAVR